MPSIDINFLESLKEDYRKFPVFIETGTYLGETIFAIERYFDQLYTIEIKEEFYNNAARRYNGNKIRFVLGDSSKKFLEILPTIKSPSIFFLDGHWSAGNTGRGEKDCPLYEELSAINTHFSNEAILILDDMRLCETGPQKGKELCDWESVNIKDLRGVVANRTTDTYLLPSSHAPNDRLIIHLRKL